jgi:hypothetical protein
MARSVEELTTVLANLVPGRCCGRSCARPGVASRVVALELLFDRCLYTDSRAWLTEHWRLHSGGRGDVLSTWVPTVWGMAPHCPGWRYSGGDGRTGPEVMEDTRFADLTSPRRSRRVWSWWPYPFRGCRRPILRGATWKRYRSRRHSVTE